jgi:acetyl esterase/lipase
MLYEAIILVFFLIILLFLYLKFVKDPEMEISSKIIHYVVTFLFNSVGANTSSKFSRKMLTTLAGTPKTYKHKGVESKDYEIPHYKENDKKVKIRIFENVEDSNKQKPVFIYIHGGGFVLEFDKLYDDHCRRIAKQGMIVIAINYRLAPENPFPAPVHDCFSVVNWLQNPKDCDYLTNANFKKICIGGDSAGGNLTAVLITMIRDHELKLDISAQILIYPTIFHEPHM